MGNCETCVNSSKTAKGNNKISYDKKKRHSKTGGAGSRHGSFATNSNYGGYNGGKLDLKVCAMKLTYMVNL